MILTTIENALDTMETKISWQDIANAAGITKGALSHFKSGSELKFPTLLRIAKFVFKKNYFPVFNSWCLIFNQPKNIRYSLEYLAINRQAEELSNLILKVKEEQTNAKLIDCAVAYDFWLMYITGENPSEIMRKLRVYNPKTQETKALACIIELWCKNRIGEYTGVASLLNGLDLVIDQIEDDYIRESYTLRLQEALATINLFRYNNTDLARKYSKEIISKDTCATLTANAYYIVGMSYLFSNYEECLGNVIENRDRLIELGRYRDAEIVEKNDLPFINNFWKKHTKPPETDDISEIAHYEASVGSKELALALVDESIAQDGLSGFKLYYKAIATGDMRHFMESLIFFVKKKDDNFYANLPYLYLKNDPTFKSMADMLMFD